MAKVDSLRNTDAMVSAPARPTVRPAAAGTRTMVIRDEDAARWQSGRYRFTFHCAGEGSVVAHVSFGAASVIRELAPCRPEGATDTLVLRAPTPVDTSTVMIIPVGPTEAAIGYDVTRES